MLPTEDNEWRNWKLPDRVIPPPDPIPPLAEWNADFGGTGAPANVADEICRTVRNEVQVVKQWGRENFEDHMVHDVLIGWAFDPGPDALSNRRDDLTADAKASDIMHRERFVALSMGWFDAGMPCEGDTGEQFAYEPVGFGGFSLAQILQFGGLIGRDGMALDGKGALAGVAVPESVPEVSPPQPEELKEVQISPGRRANAWVRGPVEGGLTKEHLDVLERSGLHPYASSIDEVRRVLEGREQ